MTPQMSAAKQVMHKMSAAVELCAHCEPCEHRSGMFGGEDGYTWNILPQERRRLVHLEFHATGGDEALGLVHKIMQRHARGRSNPSNLRAKRARYGPNDYTVVELRHPGTGSYLLPRGPNPDLSPKPRVKKVSNQTEMELV